MNLLNPITFSNQDLFTVNESRISLKEYPNNSIFHASYDSNINASYSIGSSTALYNASYVPQIVSFGKFNSGVNLNSGYLKYHYENFTSLITEGTISFWIRNPNATDPGYVEFSASTAPTITTGDYGFKIKVGSDNWRSITVALTAGNSLTNISNAIHNAISSYNAGSHIVSSKIQIYTTANDTFVYIDEPDSGSSLITLLGSVSDPYLPNAPAADTKLLDLYNESNSYNRITLIHSDDSELILNMYNSTGTQIVNKNFGTFTNTTTRYYHIELSWNETFAQLFINGESKGIALTGFSRTDTNNYLFIGERSSNSTYYIDEVLIYSEVKNIKNFTSPSVAVTQFDVSDPYVDIYFGTGYSESEVLDLNVTCSTGCSFVVKIGNYWWYYYSGNWIVSDGTYIQSCGKSDIETKFGNLLFSSDLALTIRVFFDSDGNTECYIENIEVIKGSANETAIITGTVALSSTVNLSTYKYLTISTKNETKTIDLTSAASSASAVTLTEIKAAINNASISDLASASSDSSYHLVLQSISKGESATVAIIPSSSYDAAPYVFGSTQSDEGADEDTITFDYSTLFTWIRTQLGAPLVPVELTDEQLRSCLFNAVYQFNRWRNFREDLIYTDLISASDGIGYIIPPEVGGSENITEIIVKPRWPFSFTNNVDDILTNIYLQSIFNNKSSTSAGGGLTSYYLTLSTIKDMNIILGTQVKWDIINGNLYIHPEPGNGTRIGIRYRSAITLDEINSNFFIRNYVLAEAKIILGTIRSTFGGQIPGGGEMINIRGEALISEGKEEKDKLIQEMIATSQPLMFEFV